MEFYPEENSQIWDIVLPTTKMKIKYTEEQKKRFLKEYLKKIDIINIIEEEDCNHQ